MIMKIIKTKIIHKTTEMMEIIKIMKITTQIIQTNQMQKDQNLFQEQLGLTKMKMDQKIKMKKH